MLLCTKRQIASIFRSTQGSLKRSILSTINQKLFLSVSYTSRFICGKNKQTPPHLRPSGEKSRKPLPERKVAANRAAIRPEEIWVCEKKSSTNAELTIKYLAVIFNFLRSRDLIVQGDVRTVLKFAERSCPEGNFEPLEKQERRKSDLRENPLAIRDSFSCITNRERFSNYGSPFGICTICAAAHARLALQPWGSSREKS